MAITIDATAVAGAADAAAVAPVLGYGFSPPAGVANAAAAAPQLFETGPNGYAYVYENVGLVTQPVQTGHAYVYENVGLVTQPVQTGHAYVYENVGMLNDPAEEGFAYVYENVDTGVPFPHVWFVRPTSGREGDGFAIYGHGFGQTSAQYDGHAYLGQQPGWNGVGPIDAAYQLSETAWQQIAASANAYGAARLTDPLTGTPDPEHQRIDVIVYVGADSGVVRVQTVKP